MSVAESKTDIEGAVENEVVVLTGSIGSGKSTVAGMLEQLGAVVVRADMLAREVVLPGTPALAEIVAEFGPDVLDESGELNRKKLAARVFASDSELLRLEEITHPRIRELSHGEFVRARAGGAPLIVYDCPLYFESGLEDAGFRCSVLVTATPEQCIARVMSRDGVDEQSVRARLAHQMSPEEKARLSTFVIENNSTLDELRGEVTELFKRLLSPPPVR